MADTRSPDFPLPLTLPYEGVRPALADDVFVAPGAVIIGDTHIGAGSSVWFGVVVRGDVNGIRIGRRCNIQDGSVVHVTHERFATTIGDDVSIGHNATIHGCWLEDGCLIGMGAVILDGVVVEKGALVAAGTLVAPGKRVEAGMLWAGNPGRPVRPVRAEESRLIAETARHYQDLAAKYRAGG